MSGPALRTPQAKLKIRLAKTNRRGIIIPKLVLTALSATKPLRYSGFVKLLDAECFATPAGRLKQRGAAHPSKADYNNVLRSGSIYSQKTRNGLADGSTCHDQENRLLPPACPFWTSAVMAPGEHSSVFANSTLFIEISLCPPHPSRLFFTSWAKSAFPGAPRKGSFWRHPGTSTPWCRSISYSTDSITNGLSSFPQLPSHRA